MREICRSCTTTICIGLLCIASGWTLVAAIYANTMARQVSKMMLSMLMMIMTRSMDEADDENIQRNDDS